MKKAYAFITQYLLLFILAAFIGWVYEIICVFALFGHYMDRGVLHLPLCPIYGFGMLFLYLVFKKVKNPFAVFFGSALITTVIEYLAALVFENCFHQELWTYRSWPLNFRGRISLISSLSFGLMATLYLLLVIPPVKKLFASKAGRYLSLFTTLLFLFCLGWELSCL